MVLNLVHSINLRVLISFEFRSMLVRLGFHLKSQVETTIEVCLPAGPTGLSFERVNFAFGEVSFVHWPRSG